MNRPTYTIPANTPAPLAAMLLAAAARKTVYVDARGEAFWLNAERAEAIAAKNGGTLFPPEA